MGTGKTFIAASAAYMAGFKRVLVLCPPHLTRKWKREVEETVPGARAVIVASITDLERLRTATGDGPLFAVMSRERAKLSYRWQPAVVERWATSGGRLVRDEETGEPFRVPCCPDCHAQVVDKDGVPLSGRDLARRKRTCSECGSALWQADRSGPKRYPLSDYVKHRLRGFFDLLIGDEVHEFKARGSAQGIAAGVLADACGKSLSLSGTLMGGYSSTLFHLLYRFSPEIRGEFGRSEESRWIERYGFVEHTIGRDDPDSFEDGRTSRRKRYRKVVQGAAGARPRRALPPHRQLGLPAARRRRRRDSRPTRSACCSPRWTRSRAVLTGSRSARATTSSMGRYGRRSPTRSRRARGGCSPPTCRRCSPTPTAARRARRSSTRRRRSCSCRSRRCPRTGSTRRSGRSSTSSPPSGWQGRRVLVYATHTGTRDITGRMEDFLSRHGFKVAVMKADAVPPERREAWVAQRVEEGVDVLICHPRLVQTGLDLVEFPTICWYETDYSVYTMRQASRRSWRIGQTEPVQVVFMAYRNTLQADALKLVAQKLQSSLAVEGELPEDGLAAYGDDGDDLMLALARKIVAGEEDTGSVESVFEQARQVAAEAEALLVDEGWHAPEPVVIEAEAVAVASDDHDETHERQRSLFSWAEFMAAEREEPPKRPRRSGAPTLSLFEWALEREQEGALAA